MFHKNPLLRAISIALSLTMLFLTGCNSDAKDEKISTVLSDGVITVEGEKYVLQDDLITILFMGLDKYERPDELKGYTNKMQADFFLLLVVDGAKNRCELLHLNRDTMTEIRRLGVGGGVSGKFEGQLALSHTYGSGGSDSSLNAVKAVSTLLGGIKIDHYMTVTMDAVSVLNDLLGGVTVTVLEDFTEIDPALKKGETVTLHGEQALTYVRSRYGVGNQSNLNRMERQRQYLEAFYTRLMVKNAEEEGFLADAIMRVNDSFMSDCSVAVLEDLGQLMSRCSLEPIRSLPGKAVVGGEFMEFYVDEAALEKMILELFYQKL